MSGRYYLENLAVFKPERQSAIIKLILAIQERERQREERRDSTWAFGQDAHQVWNVLNNYFYKDYNSVQGDPLGLGVHFPRQQARVNVNMFVARLADSVACWALFGI
ncbi:hypothetical protein ACKLNR_002575 [Fusarium oxysporum f. sp. zingiberi]